MRMRNFLKCKNAETSESVEEIHKEDFDVSAVVHGGNHGDLGSLRKLDTDYIAETFPTDMEQSDIVRQSVTQISQS